MARRGERALAVRTAHEATARDVGALRGHEPGRWTGPPAVRRGRRARARGRGEGCAARAPRDGLEVRAQLGGGGVQRGARPPAHQSEKNQEGFPTASLSGILPIVNRRELADEYQRRTAVALGVSISFVFTWGEPVVMVWTVAEGRMVILALRPISELELSE